VADEAAAKRYARLGSRLYGEHLSRAERRRIKDERLLLLGKYGPDIRRMEAEARVDSSHGYITIRKPPHDPERPLTAKSGSIVVLLLDSRREVVKRFDVPRVGRGKGFDLWEGGLGFSPLRFSKTGKKKVADALSSLASRIKKM